MPILEPSFQQQRDSYKEEVFSSIDSIMKLSLFMSTTHPHFSQISIQELDHCWVSACCCMLV